MVEYINQLNQECQRCSELVKSRKRITWGYGNIKSPIIFIGEAPGYLGCDRTGIPFKGDKSGDLYEKMLDSIGQTIETVYTTNVVKCCPPKNRNPLPEEIINCKSYLRQEIEAVSPLLIIPLGRIAIQIFNPYIQGVLRMWDKEIISSVGRIICLPHPAYICRNQKEEEKYIRSFRNIGNIIQGIKNSKEIGE